METCQWLVFWRMTSPAGSDIVWRSTQTSSSDILSMLEGSNRSFLMFLKKKDALNELVAANRVSHESSFNRKLDILLNKSSSNTSSASNSTAATLFLDFTRQQPTVKRLPYSSRENSNEWFSCFVLFTAQSTFRALRPFKVCGKPNAFDRRIAKNATISKTFSYFKVAQNQRLLLL